MPRARNIKPGFFENEHLGVLSGDTRLLFAALWTLADKQGVVECRIPKIRTYAFRYRTDITDEMVNRELTVLTRLDNGGMLSRVSHEGSDYLLIHNFLRHASPHHTEKRGDYPDFDMLMSLINSDFKKITVNSRKCNGENPPESLISIPETLISNIKSVDKKSSDIFNFDIERLLDDKSRQAAKEKAPGWDLYYLIPIFNDWIKGKSIPDNPAGAFINWCGTYTKGKQL